MPTSPSSSILPSSGGNWLRDLGDPFEELFDMHNRLSTILARKTGNGGSLLGTFSDSDWSPKVDIFEEDSCFKIQADLPDVKKEDVHVTLNNGMLTVSGERKQEKEEKGRRYHRIERNTGSYSRSFRLPDGIDSDHVDAVFKDGVLTLKIPKTENYKGQNRTIEIH